MTSSRPRAGKDIKFVPKGWGFEKWIVNCEQYCGKLLFIAKEKNAHGIIIIKRMKFSTFRVEKLKLSMVGQTIKN